MAIVTELKKLVGHLKTETFALYLAARDPRTPWYAKVVVVGVVAYAFSPIDLIPDFIPVLGYLDDLILVPLGIYLAVKLVPPAVLLDCRARAQQSMQTAKRVSLAAAAVIVAIWLTLAWLGISWIYRTFIRS